MRLCPYCHNPLSDADVDQLEAENAKLFSLLKHESKQVEKLRELARDMWRELDALVPYDPYDHDGLDEYRARMRELGVEV